jgi:hypothetical protein
MKVEVAAFTKNCPTCQRNKSENVPYPGLLQPLPIPDMAWQHITMDFIEALPKSDGHDTILVEVNKLTKDQIFTSQLWQDLFKSLRVNLKFSSAYHPQTDGQSE